MKVKADEGLNTELKEEVQSLRGSICSNIKKESEKFKIEYSDELPNVIITNLENGKKTTCPLFAAKGVVRVLEDLL